MVIWFQGCPLACPGCFNPETHEFEAGLELSVGKLLEHVLAERPHIEGVTLSGGEPFAQAKALAALLSGISQRSSLSVVVFSGYTKKEILNCPVRAKSLPLIDVLIAGRYVQTQRIGQSLLGSRNQRIHLLSDRYTLEEVTVTPECEMQIHSTGYVTISGIDPPY